MARRSGGVAIATPRKHQQGRHDSWGNAATRDGLAARRARSSQEPRPTAVTSIPRMTPACPSCAGSESRPTNPKAADRTNARSAALELVRRTAQRDHQPACARDVHAPLRRPVLPVPRNARSKSACAISSQRAMSAMVRCGSRANASAITARVRSTGIESHRRPRSSRRSCSAATSSRTCSRSSPRIPAEVSSDSWRSTTSDQARRRRCTHDGQVRPLATQRGHDSAAARCAHTSIVA